MTARRIICPNTTCRTANAPERAACACCGAPLFATLDEWLSAAAVWCGSDDPGVRAMGIAKIGEVAGELVARGIS